MALCSALEVCIIRCVACQQIGLYHGQRSAEASFEEAKLKLSGLPSDPGNDVKLKLYALFKQAIFGKNRTPNPGALNFVAQVKWSAWNDLHNMSKDEAKDEYVKLVNELTEAEGTSKKRHPLQETETKTKTYGTAGLLVNTENQIMTITLNRPEKYNAITREMYEQIPVILSNAAKDNSVSIVVFTGSGKYYCSGNDLENFKDITPANMKQKVVEGSEICKRYVESYINFPKPLVAAVNGPAVGIPVTSLGLFDAVFASDNATFLTPFSKTGQTPEACSSYLFPRIMGYAKACSLLLFNELLSAAQAEKVGLVTKVFSHDIFKEELQQELDQMVGLPIKSLVYSKKLMRDPERDYLHEVNAAECERLAERWASEECIKAITSFVSKK